MIPEVNLFYYWYFISFLNETGISQCKLFLTHVIVLLVQINYESITSTKTWISQEPQDNSIRPPCEQISHIHFLVNQHYILTNCLLISDRHQCCQLLKIVYVHDNDVVTIIVQCNIGVLQGIAQVCKPVELQHKRVKAKV